MLSASEGVSRRAVLGLGVVVLGSGIVGCSAGDGSGDEVDPSWVSEQVGPITVRHPKEWVEKPSTSKVFTKMFTDDKRSMLIAGNYSNNADPVLAYGKLDVMAAGALEGYHSRGHQDLTVQGAAKAAKCPFEFTQDGQKMAGWWLIASAAASVGKTAVVSLNLPDDDDSSIVDKIASTMVFKQ
ncbi:Tat pathway signal sequence [Cutibacterium avidum]|uniref:Tat pathway signal sequence n=1 Tax=Cutibacterium avidum TaxID=33010 RepID=UPI0008F563F0|nr:Tat pathway signal sequence [Cutibacterium avidum]MDK7697711.1 Tat pathway signal sequence [Cutibacterium avidum]MDQ9080261.1 Tat pathway signal sequence [Cutibacterium avidum]OIJ79505.1 Tat pathway signal sequence [Cutibacterium avidum]